MANAIPNTPDHERQDEVISILQESRDVTALERIAGILATRKGLSYSPETVEKRARHRLRKAFNAGERLGQTAFRSVLDVGCARAENARYLKEMGVEKYVGLDIDDNHFPSLSELPPGSVLLKASAEDIPLPDNSIDLAISFNVFEHVPNPANALKEIVRVLRPGGMFFTEFGPPFNACSGPHLTRYVDLPYMHHLFSDDVVAKFVGRSNAYETVNRRPVSYYREFFHKEEGFSLPTYRELIDGRGFWILKAFPEIVQKLSEDEVGANSITAVVVKN